MQHSVSRSISGCLMLCDPVFETRGEADGFVRRKLNVAQGALVVHEQVRVGDHHDAEGIDAGLAEREVGVGGGLRAVGRVGVVLGEVVRIFGV